MPKSRDVLRGDVLILTDKGARDYITIIETVIPQAGLSYFIRYGFFKYRAGVDKCMKFAVFSAGVNIGGELR